MSDPGMSESGLSLGQPLPFRLLIDEAAKLGKRHFRAIFPVVALPTAVFQTLLTLGFSRWTMQWMSAVQGRDLGTMLGTCSGFLLLTLFSIVYFSVIYGALTHAAMQATTGRPIEMASSGRWILRPAHLGTQLLIGLLVLVGLLFFVAPGVFFLLYFGLALPVMVEEGLVGWTAIRRSGALARYNPRGGLWSSPMFKIFVLFVVGYLLSTAVSLVVQLPFTLAQEVIVLRKAAGGASPEDLVGGTLGLQLASGLLGGLAQIAVSIYLTFGLSLLYFDVRHRSEGRDLEAALDELERRAGVTPSPAWARPQDSLPPAGLPPEGAPS